MSLADQIRDGLVARGMAPHIADAFIWNFQHESGLDPSVVERVPNVHGTRGKGLYQLTGPRRTAFERAYGGDYSVDNQLDWLMYELQGPESRAWERIQGAPDTGQAAAAIVTHFLRPAEQHRARRVAEYTSGRAPAISGGPAPPYDAARPPSVFNPPPEAGQNALAGFFEQPSAPSDPRLNALAALEQFRPRRNALNPEDFMTQQAPMNLLPMPGIS